MEVDSDATLLSVVDNPVDNEPMPVDVDVDSDATLLSVVDSPVDSEPIPVEVEVDSDAIELVVLDRPVDVDVDRLSIAVFVANSCEPLIASVLVAVT
ncbi:ATPase [Burkholderia anthina]|uniref:ATPase n=1 Tax=Burkholderia anthina TaxID=179879 RepID=A0A6P2G795_9BURK|nr:ATPase [Burkholderia anthina]